MHRALRSTGHSGSRSRLRTKEASPLLLTGFAHDSWSPMRRTLRATYSRATIAASAYRGGRASARRKPARVAPLGGFHLRFIVTCSIRLGERARPWHLAYGQHERLHARRAEDRALRHGRPGDQDKQRRGPRESQAALARELRGELARSRNAPNIVLRP